jgi:hypothetical protein
MKQDVEQYLKENRLKLDSELPDEEKIWKDIRRNLRSKNEIRNNGFWKIAAIFLLGILTTYVVVKETSREKVVVIKLGDISPELGQKEAEFNRVVDQKWAEIKPLSQDEIKQFGFLLDELDELDKIYKAYENDLHTVGENEQIINVLLDYYQKKIQLLNRLSLEIQKQKSHENNVTI